MACPQESPSVAGTNAAAAPVTVVDCKNSRRVRDENLMRVILLERTHPTANAPMNPRESTLAGLEHLLDPTQGLPCPLLVLYQGESHMPIAMLTKANTWTYCDFCFQQELL